MPLTDVAIRNAKPKEKPYKLGDTLGLFLLVQPSGGKLWRLKYRFEGREKKLAIGTYPQLGLAEARKRRDEARDLLSLGRDPSREKKREKLRSQLQAENTFKAIADEFCKKRRKDGAKAWAESTATRSEYLLSLLDGSIGHPISKLAMQLAPHVFVRPGELRHAEWADIDLESALWTIPASKTKMRKDHLVPLSRQAVAILEEAKAFSGPDGYVFRSIRTRLRPMSDNTINAGLRRLGYTSDEMTGHGFRAMASTLLNESGKWHPDAIERALAHGDSDKVRAAYHRGAHWDERVRMAQWWSDYLDQLRKGADVVPIAAGRS
ncbi:integrase arm-type DNA-binding domain-containing protein [Altererythrobacter indicus]|uniref:Integrase arm-type DNA-binding domain-containing protein n=1 Tax=Altericroceibacterium indicum TaxID=374177 RepID=A0A845AEC5_9SPHN|nr:site-specific integrase [Altericroceibacterium indicum]MXP27155.1 integrase arm-type DNA-binding domain-containing protein [Altericroceibacterium indicum]